eukprot:scaffold124630_cov87-Phaeocystis_antarctica.AAC.1
MPSPTPLTSSRAEEASVFSRNFVAPPSASRRLLNEAIRSSSEGRPEPLGSSGGSAAASRRLTRGRVVSVRGAPESCSAWMQGSSNRQRNTVIFACDDSSSHFPAKSLRQGKDTEHHCKREIRSRLDRNNNYQTSRNTEETSVVCRHSRGSGCSPLIDHKPCRRKRRILFALPTSQLLCTSIGGSLHCARADSL